MCYIWSPADGCQLRLRPEVKSTIVNKSGKDMKELAENLGDNITESITWVMGEALLGDAMLSKVDPDKQQFVLKSFNTARGILTKCRSAAWSLWLSREPDFLGGVKGIFKVF